MDFDLVRKSWYIKCVDISRIMWKGDHCVAESAIILDNLVQVKTPLFL